MLIETLQRIVGPKGWTTDPQSLEPHLVERRGRARGSTPIMVSPNSTAQVSEVVRACAGAGAVVVPQGGNTGLCGGAIPDDSGEQVLLSMARMNEIRAVDAEDFSLIVEAGCILADIQSAAQQVDRLFPLSLSAEGSCQIGGNLATNAGGINVIRYGTARQQVLGLEVVLADGTVWDGLRTVRKDTAGYDIKQLFIGSEGTLGIITAAALRLWPCPRSNTTLLAGLGSAHAAVQFLSHLRESVGDSVQAFELISDRCIRYAERHIPDVSLPFDDEHPWFVLTDISVEPDTAALEACLMTSLESGLLSDAVIAKNESESAQLWRIRHSLSDAQKPEGASLKHDISVPTSRIAEFVAEGDRIVTEQIPGARLVTFGHVGDGNLHYNISQPRDAEGSLFLSQGPALTEKLYDLAIRLGGSFSAEHGVGAFKRAYLEQYRGGVELQLMRTVKTALDPDNRLNPGKVI